MEAAAAVPSSSTGPVHVAFRIVTGDGDGVGPRLMGRSHTMWNEPARASPRPSSLQCRTDPEQKGKADSIESIKYGNGLKPTQNFRCVTHDSFYMPPILRPAFDTPWASLSLLSPRRDDGGTALTDKAKT